MKRLIWAIVLSGAAMGGCDSAQAQVKLEENQGLFARDRNVSVMERPHPDYDPLPIAVGSLQATPELDVGAEYEDNTFAAQTAPKSDEVLLVAPKLDLASTWQRNAFGAYVHVASRLNSRFHSESTTDWQAGAGGRFDLGSGGQLAMGGDTGALTEPRYATNTAHNSRQPVRYDQSDLFVAAEETRDRVRLSVRFDAQDLDYHNAVDDTGRSLLEDDRDRWAMTYTAKTELALSPSAAVFVTGAYNEHLYRLRPPLSDLDRNSQGGQASLGADFELTRLVRGEVQVGYLKQTFTSATLPALQGLSALGKLEYFPTQLTTVTFTGTQGVQDAGIDGAPAFLARATSLRLDHELLRNLVLSASGSLESDRYDAINRQDQLTEASLGARYLMNRLLTLNLKYSYLQVASHGPERGPQYRVNRIMASTALRF